MSLAEVGLITHLWLVTMVTYLQTMSVGNEKVRPANLTAAEKDFLIKLSLKYQAVIDNKKIDEVTAYVSCVQLAWSEGWRPPGSQSAFIKWTGWILAMALRHDDSPINIVVELLLIIIIKIVKTTNYRHPSLLNST